MNVVRSTMQSAATGEASQFLQAAYSKCFRHLFKMWEGPKSVFNKSSMFQIKYSWQSFRFWTMVLAGLQTLDFCYCLVLML